MIKVTIEDRRRDHRLLAHEIAARAKTSYTVTFNGQHSVFTFKEEAVGQLIIIAIKAMDETGMTYKYPFKCADWHEAEAIVAYRESPVLVQVGNNKLGKLFPSGRFEEIR